MLQRMFAAAQQERYAESDRLAIEANEPNHTLFLAVPLDVYQTLFQLEFTQTAVQRYQILLVVYNPVNEAIL